MDRHSRGLPPLNAVPAFEAAARLLSFSAAARELNVTQSAVSRQIRLLEEDLGTALFIRQNRTVRLTARGRELLPVAANALTMLAATCREFRKGVAPTRLKVSADLSFGHERLVTILANFNVAHPEIAASVIASDYEPDCLREDVDLAILFGNGTWPGHEARFLFGEEVFPVCSPGYLAEHGPMALDTLLDHHLLDVEGRWDWMTWAQWLQRFDMTVGPETRLQESNNWPLLMEAARRGRGVALGWRYITDLADGSLVRPVKESVTTDLGYYLVIPSDRTPTDPSAAFMAWLETAFPSLMEQSDAVT